jgi:hypothetical protein
MSTKRPLVDLMALTSEQATPMPEAAQRMAPEPSARSTPTPAPAAVPKPPPVVTTANLEALAFKVPPAFRRRFRQRAVAADLKLNELLFASLDAWEQQQGLKK